MMCHDKTLSCNPARPGSRPCRLCPFICSLTLSALSPRSHSAAHGQQQQQQKLSPPASPPRSTAGGMTAASALQLRLQLAMLRRARRGFRRPHEAMVVIVNYAALNDTAWQCPVVSLQHHGCRCSPSLLPPTDCVRAARTRTYTCCSRSPRNQ